MSSLVDAKNAWLTLLRTQVGAEIPTVNVFFHGGKFDRKQLETYSKKAPALALALIRFDPVLQGGTVASMAHWAIMAFTVNGARGDGDRHDTAIALAEVTSRVVSRAFAGQNASGATSRPQDVLARNQFGFELDRQNVAMWSIEFVQVVDLVTQVDSVPFERMNIVWDLSPRDNNAELGDIPEAEDDTELG